MTEEIEEPGIAPAEVEEPAEPATAEETEETAEDPGAEPPKQSRGVQKRIDELVKQREEERRERLYWQQQAVEAMKQRPQEQPRQEAPTQAPAPPGLPPDRYDYDSPDQYQQAVGQWQSQNAEYTRHLIREEQKQAQEAATRKSAEARQWETQQQTARKLSEAAERGAKKYADFQEVAYVHESVATVVAKCENADEIAYFWGKNPDKAKEFLDLVSNDPTYALYELGKLDASLTKKPKASQAPPPPSPLGARATPTYDTDKLSAEEWIKLRNEGKI